MPPLTALLDANVLWPISLCSVLLRAAEADLYQPRWSEAILAELARSLKRRRPDLDPVRIDRRIADMRSTFPEAMVTGYEALVPIMRNDPKDRHVLAAAVRVNAAVIVTENVTDFPVFACEPYQITVQTADEFLLYLWYLDPDAMSEVLKQEAAILRNPPKTVRELVETLSSIAPAFAATVLASERL